MRTTLNIDDRLLAEAKQIAARTHRPIGAVLDDALRVYLSGTRRRRNGGRFELPRDGQGGLRPGVDLNDKEQLAELLGDNEFPRADP